MPPRFARHSLAVRVVVVAESRLRRQKVTENKRMALTKIQRIVLQRYQGYRQQPPTLLGLFRQSWQVEAILIVASALVIWFAYNSYVFWAVYLVAGLLVGALARDVGSFRRFLQVWPALSQVLDWQRVEQELSQEQAD